MAEEEFRGAIDDAKKMERKLVEYAPYKGTVEIERTMDLEPREYLDLTYPDMINLYERTQKIISTTGLLIAATGAGQTEGGAQAETAQAAPIETPQTAATQEVESRLKEMTTETLKKAQEVGKEPIVIEQQPQPEASKANMTIEFETRPASEAQKPSEEIEIERPEPKPESELETPEKKAEEERAAPESPLEAPEKPRPEIMEKPSAPRTEEIQMPAEKRVIVAAVPPALSERPEANKRYAQMEEQVRAAVGEKADEITLKKKMLELTKQLFKEKSMGKREEIKLQITILKNMLSGAQGAGKGSQAPSKKMKGDETHLKMLDALASTHQAELAQTKDSIIDSYNKQIATIKKKFYEDISATEDPAERKKIFESFVFSVTSIVEQLPEVISKYKEFTTKKHSAELQQLQGSLGSDEKDAMKAVATRLDTIQPRYEQEFASVKGIIAHQIDNLIEITGSEIMKGASDKPATKAGEKEGKEYEIVKEINEMDEGTLLYFLHTNDPDTYKKYERKLISKAEAIFKGKELVARTKGLSEGMVKRYFTHTEG